MGTCCCKFDDEPPRNPLPQRYSEYCNSTRRLMRNEVPHVYTPMPTRRNAGIQNQIVRTQPRVEPPVWMNQRVEVHRPYPTITSPRENSRWNSIENERKKRISYRKQINLNIRMLRELLRAVNINKPELPLKQTYTYTFLDEKSPYYEFVMSRFKHRQFKREYEITSILRVWNPYIFAQYRLKKLVCEQEKRLLFHGTGAEHLLGILTNNFDWRKVEKGKSGWGFATNPWYASHFSTKLTNGDNSDYIMILAKVLVLDETNKVPAEDCDTSRSPEDEQVLVKFDDCCFYPEFVVYFRRRIHNNSMLPSSDAFPPYGTHGQGSSETRWNSTGFKEQISVHIGKM